MKFWKLDKLKTQLRSEMLSELESLHYLVMYVVLTEFALYMPKGELNRWDYLEAVIALVCAVGGTVYVYRCNGGAQGVQFLQRYLAVGWVVAIRMMAWVLPLFVVLFLGLDLIKEETNWQMVLFWSLFFVALYVRTGHHVADIALPAKKGNVGDNRDM
jgi:hypothetical protein